MQKSSALNGQQCASGFALYRSQRTDLLLDPEISDLEAVGQLDCGLPAQLAQDERIFRVAAAHTLWPL